MNGLYPIIRRKRRPLLPEEPVVAGSVPASVPESVPDGRVAGAAAPVPKPVGEPAVVQAPTERPKACDSSDAARDGVNGYLNP